MEDIQGMKEYAVYKGDKFITSGTAEECAAFMGVKPETVKYYTTPTYQRKLSRRKNSRNPLIVIIL